MPPRDHLELVRLTRREPRRKKPGFGSAPVRIPGQHGASLNQQVEAAQATMAALPEIEGIDPKLILRVELTNPVDEDHWRRAGLHVLAQNPGNILVLFTDDRELTEFKRRLRQFREGPQGDAENASYASLFNCIEAASDVRPRDRIGPHLVAQGIVDGGDIDGRHVYGVDVELWDAGTPMDRQLRTAAMARHIEVRGGERIGEPFISGDGLQLIRARIRGALLAELLGRPEVALIDLPPLPDFGDDDPFAYTIAELPEPVAPAENAPLLGIIDSGLNAHPFLDDLVVDRIGVPAALGTADDRGHGTRVAGVAAYGDVRDCLDRGEFASPVRIISARVVNAQGAFDDESTIPAQMRSAVTALAARGCRVINMSLGDKALLPYAGGRASPWARELDLLARELDIVIVVSAGNTASGARAPWGVRNDGILAAYPAYLTTPDNRLIDPAIAANVITVGALAHGNGLRDDPDDGVQVQAVAQRDHPSPITRSGPGISEAIKPEFCDYGGTVVFNGHTDRLIKGEEWPSAGILTTSADFRRTLLTGATGTSFAAPRVAWKAALLAGRYPNASANLIRSLLGISAELPEAAAARLRRAGQENPPEILQCLGYGVPNVAYALASDDNRTVFVADRQEIDLDQVALYAVPIPEEFRQTKGRRTIRVALAFDPPVRHTRLEYLGVRMSFYLLRGLSPEHIFEQYRAREDRSKPPGIKQSAICPMLPGIEARQSSTLQVGTFTQKMNTDAWGDTYYVAVFTHRRWAGDEIARQRFALTVELRHDACPLLYQRCSELNVELAATVRLQAGSG